MFSFWCVIDASRTAASPSCRCRSVSMLAISSRIWSSTSVSWLNCSDSCSDWLYSRVQLVVRLLENERRAGVVRLGLFRMLRGPAESVEPDRHLQPLQLVPQGQIFLRLFGLFAQRLDLKLQLRNFVADAQQIVLGVGQPALRLLLAVAVF